MIAVSFVFRFLWIILIKYVFMYVCMLVGIYVHVFVEFSTSKCTEKTEQS